jgi:hypothetical protein
VETRGEIMANEREKLTRPKGYIKKVTGICLFCFGSIAAFLFFYFSYFLAMDDHYEEMMWCLVASPLCVVLAIVGIILFFIGISEGKKQRNLTEAYKLNSSVDKDANKRD